MNTRPKAPFVTVLNVSRIYGAGARRTLLGVLISPLLTVSLVGCGSTGLDGEPHQVEYIVGGTVNAADLTYSTDGLKATNQEVGAPLPWTKKVNIKRDLDASYELTVRNTGTQPGRVTCEIVVDGESVQKATNKGVGALASCEYSPAAN